MLRESIEERLLEDNAEGEYLFPDYDGYCFANVPGTLLSLAGGSSDRTLPSDVIEVERAEYVVCLVVDGLAYRNWKRDLGRHEVIDSLTDAGVVTPITSVYPSETAAAMTTFNTGLDPVEHGILGWDQYLPELDAVVETLPFTTKESRPVADVYPGAHPDDLFPAASWYDDAEEMGIDTVSICLAGLEDTADRLVGTGARTASYATIPSLGDRIVEALESLSPPGIVTAYVNHLDSISHSSGTESDLYHTTVEQISEAVERLVTGLDPSIATETVFTLTADHGHVEASTDEYVDLTDYDEIFGLLKRSGTGQTRPPVGGPRNVRFHARDGQESRHREVLESEFDAHVLTRDAALERNLFGRGDPPEDFDQRCGDLLCIPREYSLCWEETDLHKVGQHGGLHPDELLVPFAAARVESLD